MADLTSAPGAQFEASLSGAPTGLTTVTARIVETGSGVEVTPATSATEALPGSGLYTVTMTAPAGEGDYLVAWNDGSGDEAYDLLTVSAAAATPPQPASGNDLISLDRLLDALNKLPSDMEAQEIDKYTSAITAASFAVRNYTDRDFALYDGGPATTRTFEYDDSGYIDVDDYTEVTGVTVTFPSGGFPVTLTTSQWQEYPYNAEVKDNIVLYVPFYPGTSPEMGFTYNLDTYDGGTGGPPPVVEVTATWGWPAIPEDVQQATVWTAAAFSEDARQVTSESIEGFSRSMNVLAPTALPLRARDLLDQYRKIVV